MNHDPLQRDERHAQAPRRWRHGVPLWVVGMTLFLASASWAWAATGGLAHDQAETGLPLIEHFTPEQYRGSPQNWALTQGQHGILYVGNGDGIMTFDGTRWRHIQVANHVTVRSLATAPNGRIYVGTVGDFGYLQPDADGKLAYVSLRDKIPAKARDFSDVWKIHVTDQGIYFASLKYLFRWHDGRVSVIKPDTSFHLSFLVGGHLYILEIDRGLQRVVGNTLKPVPGGTLFRDKRLYALLPWPAGGPNALIAGTRSHGWYRFDGKHWRHWSLPAAKALADGAIYGAIRLAHGKIAVATLRSGVFILDSAGRIVHHLTHASGLPTNTIFALYQDRQRGLWTATGNGLARINVHIPLTRFDERSGLQGMILSVARSHGVLYVGTSQGLYRLVPRTGANNPHFEAVPGVGAWVASLLPVDQQLMVASQDYLFLVDKHGKARRVAHAQSTGKAVRPEVLLRSRRDPDRVFVGHHHGVAVFERVDGRWVDRGNIGQLHEEVTDLVQDLQGHLWAVPWTGGLDRITLPPDWEGPGKGRKIAWTHFGKGAGLPGTQPQLASQGDHIRILTDHGIYRFDPATRRFAPDPHFANLFPDGPREIDLLHQSKDGMLWISTRKAEKAINETGHARRVHGHWQWSVAPMQLMNGARLSVIHEDADGVLWFGDYRGLYRYDPAQWQAMHDPFRTLIRGVATHRGQILFAGHAKPANPAVAYSENALRFDFAAASYDDFDANRFQAFLQGVDRGWSPWNADAHRDYTNLHEGDYRFHVRARNAYGQVGTEATFAFHVLPPWYRTPWAWALWIVSGLVLLGLFMRWRSTVLRRRNRRLVELVERRTHELADANDALTRSNDALAAQNVTDPLTGLKNRRYLHEHIEQDLAITRRQRHADDHARADNGAADSGLLFLMVDIDHFKQVNDKYGHTAGDLVLQQTARVIAATGRESDTCIRWGGEEFLVVARFAAPDAGPTCAERIREAVAAHRFDLGEDRCIDITCSVGFACHPAFASDPQALDWSQVVTLADECMYAAKRHGRNAWAGVNVSPSGPPDELLSKLRERLAGTASSALPGSLQLVTSW